LIAPGSQDGGQDRERWHPYCNFGSEIATRVHRQRPARFHPAGASLAQTEIPINYTWTAPTTGTAVDHYLVEHSINGGQWTVAGTTTENSFTLNATTGQSHQIRVAGVDSADRQGIFSVASDSYTPDEGAPGKPGKPILF